MTIIREIPDFDYSMPVVIVGGGATGLTAALAARDGGAEVLVLERDPSPMGSTSMSQGYMCAAATDEQKKHGIEDDPALFAEDIIRQSGDTDPAYAEMIARESGPTVDWLNATHDAGITVDPDFIGYGHSRARMHGPPSRTGPELMAILQRANEAAGSDIMTEAHVDAVYAEADGRVRGVRIARPDGSHEQLGCDALILATCGFGGNPEMIRTYIPDMADARYFGWEGNQGEGIRFGEALGGALADMASYQGLGLLTEPQQITIHPQVIINGAVMINRDGQRFAHETRNVSGQGRLVSAQPGGVAFVVFDEAIHDSCKHFHELKELGSVGAYRIAGTVAGLAEACGMPPAALAETLSAVEQMRTGEIADPFERDFTIFQRPLTPPFYALKVTGALYHTQGGLVVDERAQVLRPDGSALPNLFAGGGAARGITGSTPNGYLPAAGICMAVTLGRLAGSAAARLVSPAR